MKKGRPIRAGSGIGMGAPTLYGKALRARLKRRYLTHRVLMYLPDNNILPTLSREFGLLYNTVTYLLQAEGVR